MGLRGVLALARSTVLLPRGLDGDDRALDKAIDLLAEGLRDLPPSDVANRASALSNRALALATRSERTDSRRDLDEAIALGREALRVFPSGHRSLPGAAANLTSALQRRYREGGDAEDLDAAIDVARQAVASSEGADRDYHLAELAGVLHDRFELTRRVQDLDEGIAVLQQAVAATVSDTSEIATRLGNLSTWLRDRFDVAKEVEDLSRAVETARRSVSAATPNHRHYPLILTNAANTLQIWHQHIGDLAAMDEAVAWRRSAVTATPEGDPGSPEKLSHLGDTLLDRYRWTAAEDDLRDAGHAARQAMVCLPAGDPRAGTYRSNLSAVLLETYRRYNRRSDLVAAFDEAKQAIACSFPEPLARLMASSNYAAALHERADLVGAVDDAQEAIRVLDVMEQEATTFPDHPGLLVNACVARVTRFYLSSEDTDLNEAIVVGRRALASTAEDAEERHFVASVLGVALRIRHARYAAADDLIEASACAQEALRALPPEHPWQGRYRTNLGLVLISSYLRTEHSDALDHAIAVLQDGTTRVPAPRDRAILFTNLGLALFLRVHRHRSPEVGPGSGSIPDSTDHEDDAEDLNSAVHALRTAYAAAPEDDPDRPARAALLASALLSHSRWAAGNQGDADIDDAVALVEEAVGDSSDDHYTCTTVRTIAAQVHVHRYRTKAASRDLDAAFGHYRHVIATPHGAPSVRLGAAVELAACAWSEGRSAEALVAYRNAVELLPVAAWRGIDRSAREWTLTHWSGLACDAAATATATGAVEGALELLESGRGVLWSQLLDTRTDVGALRVAHPQLAERLDDNRKDFGTSAAPVTPGAEADLMPVVTALTREAEAWTRTRT